MSGRKNKPFAFAARRVSATAIRVELRQRGRRRGVKSRCGGQLPRTEDRVHARDMENAAAKDLAHQNCSPKTKDLPSVTGGARVGDQSAIEIGRRRLLGWRTWPDSRGQRAARARERGLQRGPCGRGQERDESSRPRSGAMAAAKFNNHCNRRRRRRRRQDEKGTRIGEGEQKRQQDSKERAGEEE